MSPQDYTNDPNQPFEMPIAPHRPDVEHINELHPTTLFFGVLTPMSFSVCLIALSFVFGALGIWTFVVLFWVLAWAAFLAGVAGVLLVKFGVWSVTHGQELVVVHHRK